MMFQLCVVGTQYRVRKTFCMFRAIGVVLVIWFLSTQFSDSFAALDDALTATFETLEASAVHSQQRLK